jgi:hypothetical protein
MLLNPKTPLTSLDDRLDAPAWCGLVTTRFDYSSQSN